MLFDFFLFISKLIELCWPLRIKVYEKDKIEQKLSTYIGEVVVGLLLASGGLAVGFP